MVFGHLVLLLFIIYGICSFSLVVIYYVMYHGRDTFSLVIVLLLFIMSCIHGRINNNKAKGAFSLVKIIV